MDTDSTREKCLSAWKRFKKGEINLKQLQKEVGFNQEVYTQEDLDLITAVGGEVVS